MSTVKEEITNFLGKCEEIRNCKFIMATTKIKDLLKSIVNSAELYELFNTVASKFDYVAAKQRCFIESDSGVYGSCKLILPDTVGDRLAFIFCLLVEFDRNDVNFNSFLQKYYPKDGSYYASYHLFCDEVIGSLEKIICDVYAGELSAPEQIETPVRAAIAQPSAGAAADINVICMLIESEREFISSAKLTEEDEEAAISVLAALEEAVRGGNAELIKALACGYNYLVLYTKAVSETVSELFNAIGDYASKL